MSITLLAWEMHAVVRWFEHSLVQTTALLGNWMRIGFLLRGPETNTSTCSSLSGNFNHSAEGGPGVLLSHEHSYHFFHALPQALNSLLTELNLSLLLM